MDIDLNDFLFNQATRYLGRYPSTKKKLKIHLKKKMKSKRYVSKLKIDQNLNLDDILDNIITRLVDLKILDEKNFMESLFNHFTRSLFTLKKMNQKLYTQGFESKDIEIFLNEKIFEDPELELKILKNYINKKKIDSTDIMIFKKKVYAQGFREDTINSYFKK